MSQDEIGGLKDEITFHNRAASHTYYPDIEGKVQFQHPLLGHAADQPTMYNS